MLLVCELTSISMAEHDGEIYNFLLLVLLLYKLHDAKHSAAKYKIIVTCSHSTSIQK